MRLRAGDVAWQELEGETVLLDLASGTYYTLNRTGTLLLPMLAEGATDEAMIQRLVTSTGVEESRASADVRSFLASLVAAGLVVEEAG